MRCSMWWLPSDANHIHSLSCPFIERAMYIHSLTYAMPNMQNRKNFSKAELIKIAFFMQIQLMNDDIHFLFGVHSNTRRRKLVCPEHIIRILCTFELRSGRRKKIVIYHKPERSAATKKTLSHLFRKQFESEPTPKKSALHYLCVTKSSKQV